jgi:hypothetical protein
MPLCTLHLLSLTASTTIPNFLSTLSTAQLKPVVVSRVIRWIILPTTTSTDKLLAQNIHWDILIILPSSTTLPQYLLDLIEHKFTIHAGVPSALLKDFHAKNRRLLQPDKKDVPPLTGSLSHPNLASSSQGLELSPELNQWITSFAEQEGEGAVSMLNLLSFKPGLKEDYLKYGSEFAKSAGSRRGGVAKIVGSIVHRSEEDGKTDDGNGWDEVALAHYPSINHFADMLASQDYQAVNKKYRVGSLRDTFILCTSELGIEMGGLWRKGAKL